MGSPWLTDGHSCYRELEGATISLLDFTNRLTFGETELTVVKNGVDVFIRWVDWHRCCSGARLWRVDD